MSKELKNCPFCGSTDIDPEGWMNGEGKKGPVCNNCGASADSIDWWNTRASVNKDKLPAKHCEWVKQEGTDHWWNTGCSLEFYIESGTPHECGFVFCPYCGGSLD